MAIAPRVNEAKKREEEGELIYCFYSPLIMQSGKLNDYI
jgi:hypothetical protein